ncbi:hypothetical protein [Fictibacillus barbaricus]|uniref:Iron uptake system EfeUOB component EfeO/EfeM n=1 Tax=Fictibacillus barbaricus TaxID=182136 RepID=A0ABU1TV38_9BACL|nr:hypothetical protein [Fictibacillus barbaricus]MDR7071074.1 iron uptake system EfeUOB component EfeO/EfeM [Fictibacillus barbaricus]
MQTKKYIVPMVIATSLILSACGTKGKEESTSTKEMTIADGSKEMKQTLKDLNSQLEAKDADKVAKSGEKLEESWEKFEDEVKDKDAKLYEKVETPLHTIEAGAKSEPLDVATLSKASEELNTVLSEVEKLK